MGVRRVEANPADTMNETDRLGGANIWTVIGASGVGTMIEWYDFYLFGSLALVLASQFFPSGNQTLAVLSTLATFAAGFAARPFGALFFGRIGDLVGRKYAFLVTLVIMGGATFIIGLLPTYAQIGVLAPIILVSTSKQYLERAKEEHALWGGDRYLLKPFDLEELLTMIQNLIGPA